MYLALVFLSFIGACLAGLFGRQLGSWSAAIVSTSCLFLSLFFSLFASYFTIAERKIMGAIQRRRGPIVVNYIGLLQPLADGLKLFRNILNIFSSLSKVFKFKISFNFIRIVSFFLVPGIC